MGMTCMQPRHLLTIALSLCLGTGLLAQEAAPKPSADQPLLWSRVKQDDNRNLRLQMAARTFKPVKGDGPTVTLFGAVHVADAAFYKKLDDALTAENDVVLFEGVKPSGLDDPNPAPGKDGDPARVEQSKDRLRLAAIMIRRGTKSLAKAEDPKGAGAPPVFPATLADLADKLKAAGRAREAGFLDAASRDGWGHALVYQPTPDGTSFTLTSLGADGRPGGDGFDKDIALTDLPALKPSELGDEPGIQHQLAQALGLTFQLDAMNTHPASWRNCDMSIDEVQKRLGFEEGDGEGSALFSLLDGSSLPAKFAGLVLGIVQRMPGVSVRGKVMMVEMLGSLDGDDLSMPALGPQMGKMMKVIVQDRNQVVIDAIARIIKDEPDIKRIGVLYGAGHLPDLSRKLCDQLAYKHDSGRWITAIKVDLDRAEIGDDEIEMMRTMIRGQMEMLKKSGRP